MRRHGLTCVPWEDWRTGKVPVWWNWYNEIKHHRDQYFAKANLECALKAVAGLTVMVNYLCVEEIDGGKIISTPKFITLARKYHYSTVMEGRERFCPPDYERPKHVSMPSGGMQVTGLKRK